MQILSLFFIIKAKVLCGVCENLNSLAQRLFCQILCASCLKCGRAIISALNISLIHKKSVISQSLARLQENETKINKNSI